MALSGHKDISMLNRYSHTREEEKRKAIFKLSQINLQTNYQVVKLAKNN